MSKKIKVIDLLNKIANGEDVPKKIKWRDKIWDYWEGDQDYKSKQGRWFTSNLNDIRTKEFVNDTVEIIEEEPEIDIQGIEEFEIDKNNYIQTELGAFKTRKMDIAFLNKMNKLTKAVKQLDNQINGDKQSIKWR